MLCLEWWCFEVLALFAGWLSPEQLAANVVLLNFIGLLFNFSLGMSFAVCSLVGNSMGELKPVTAKRYYFMSVLGCFILSTVIIVFILTFKSYIPIIYTQQPEVIILVEETLPIFTVMLFFDYLQGVTSGTIRAIGYQDIGTVICLVGYWIISIPISYVLAFPVDLELLGIWLGVPSGTLISSICFSAILLRSDWKSLANQITNRIQEDKAVTAQPWETLSQK